MSSAQHLPVIIIGAGIAGLTLAQGLHRHNIPFDVYEQHQPSKRSQGHRFRIDNDGAEALYETIPSDLWDLLVKTCAPCATVLTRFLDAKDLSIIDRKAWPKEQGKGPLPIDRSWISALLSLGIQDRIHYGKRLDAFTYPGDGTVHASFIDGSTTRGQFLVGADGIHSRVRQQLQPDRKLLDLERQMIWGRTQITPELLADFPEHAMAFAAILVPGDARNCIIEAMRWTPSGKKISELSEGRLFDIPDYIYWALSSEIQDGPPPRTADELRTFAKQLSKPWAPGLQILLQRANYDLAARVRVYSSKPDIGSWSSGEGLVTMIGDAAHPMSPMGGQGGNTAVKNAADLCRTIVHEGITPESVSEFEQRMRQRARDAIELSFRGGKFLWAGKEWDEYAEVDSK